MGPAGDRLGLEHRQRREQRRPGRSRAAPRRPRVRCPTTAAVAASRLAASLAAWPNCAPVAAHSNPVTTMRPSASTRRWCPSSRPCAMCTARRRSSWIHASSRTRSVIVSGGASNSVVPGAWCSTRSATAPALPANTTPGTRTPAPAARSSMYASYSTCWRRVSSSVRGASLRVRNRQARAISCASASSRPSAVTWRGPTPVSARRRSRGRRADRRSAVIVGGLGADPGERPSRRLGGRAADRGAERVVHRRRDAPAQDDRAEQVRSGRRRRRRALRARSPARGPGRPAALVARGRATRRRPSPPRPRAVPSGTGGRRSGRRCCEPTARAARRASGTRARVRWPSSRRRRRAGRGRAASVARGSRPTASSPSAQTARIS